MIYSVKSQNLTTIFLITNPGEIINTVKQDK